MLTVGLTAEFRKVKGLRAIEVNSRKLWESIAPTFGSAEEEVLYERIVGFLKFTRYSVKINPAFVQIRNSVCNIECALHAVGDLVVGHSKAVFRAGDP